MTDRLTDSPQCRRLIPHSTSLLSCFSYLQLPVAHFHQNVPSAPQSYISKTNSFPFFLSPFCVHSTTNLSYVQIQNLTLLHGSSLQCPTKQCFTVKLTCMSYSQSHKALVHAWALKGISVFTSVLMCDSAARLVCISSILLIHLL